MSREKIKIAFTRFCLLFIRMKQYTFDENYFDIIDTEDKAYVLGLVFADGYNYEVRGVVSISLQARDKEILEKISIAMKNTKPLKFVDMVKYHKGKSHQNQYRLSFSSRHTSETLARLGCIQRKSYLCRFPTILAHLTSHFIRGYFDGDGCISYTYDHRKRPCGSVSFVGSKHFCKSLSLLLKQLEINSNVSYEKRCNKHIRRIAFGGRNQLVKFCKYIYEDASIYLNRKKAKFDDFITISGNLLVANKSTNVYRNTRGSKRPFRVVKTLNYKSIHLGSFETRDEALKASTDWDKTHSSTSVE